METKTIEEILSYLCEELGGDWFLTGGALVRLIFDADRGTEDVDLVRIRHSELSDEAAKNQLFRWLIDRELGPEWVNSAVEPFVREVPGWESEVVLFRSGAKGRVLRPTITLFVYLKLRRGTEIDLLDIEKAISKCPEKLDEARLLAWGNARVNERFAGLKARSIV